MSYIWMKVSADKYRLPEILADSAKELADLCGTTLNSVYSGVSHYEHGRKGSRFERVKVTDD